MKSTLEKKSKFFNSYFIIVTLLYIVGISFISGQVGNYIPIFYGLFGFVFFAINFGIEFNSFSNLLRRIDPLLFNVYAIQYGPFKGTRLNNLIVFNASKEIRELRNIELTQRYRLLVKLMKLIGISFVLTPLITIILFIK